MAMAMKSWHVTVLKNHFTQVECIRCVSAKEATDKLAEMKAKYVDDPTATPPVKYGFFREQF